MITTKCLKKKLREEWRSLGDNRAEQRSRICFEEVMKVPCIVFTTEPTRTCKKTKI